MKSVASTERPIFTRGADGLALEDDFKVLQQRTGRVQQRTDETLGSEEDAGDMDWIVTYADMITLIMAFFIFLTAMSHLEPLPTSELPPTPQISTPQLSPFDGQGFTMAEFGHPASRDPVVSKYDDPDAQNSASPPAPSGERNTGLTAGAPPPVPPPLPVALVDAPLTPAAGGSLAQQLQKLVRDDNLGGQVEVITGAQTVTLRISEKILFASGRADLEAGGAALVARLSAILAATDGMVSIEGHTDDRPIKTSQFASNWELSADRATEVLRTLAAKGLPANRMRAVAYADTRPVAVNDSSNSRAENRRVELVITSDAGKP